MRNGQNKRMRGRNNNRSSGGGGGGNNNNRGHNPLTKVFESNGPDVKIRGTASHVADKYIQLARDAQSSGDPVAAENYYQHAEHYFRLIAAAQEQFRQSPQYQAQNNGSDVATGNDSRDGAGNDSFDDDEGDDMGSQMGEQPQFGTRDPQPYIQRDAQFDGQNNGGQNNGGQNNNGQRNDQQPQQHQNRQPRHQHNNNNNNNQASNGQGSSGPGSNGNDLNGLPSFITGGGQPQPNIQQPDQGDQNGQGDGDRNGGERYGFRRRGRHRRPGGPRPEGQGVQGAPQDGGGDTPTQE